MEEDRLDAMKLLRIWCPHLNAALNEKQGVIDYMITVSYRRTPNLMLCNREVHWCVLKWHKQGADYITTGHYADRWNKIACFTRRHQRSNVFLWTLTQKDLSHVLFRWHMVKDDVRREAEKTKLNNEFQKDSQGLCFVGNDRYQNTLKEYIKEKPPGMCVT